MNGGRDLVLDAVKGIAIVLMVLCHAAVAADVREFIYLFHMPVFFIAAGWCHPFGRISTITGGGYIRRRIVRLWVPFALVGGAFVLGHDLMMSINIYSADPDVAGMLSGGNIPHVWSVRETAVRFLRTLLMRDGMEGMGGAFWFLRTIFFASVLYMAADAIFHRFFSERVVWTLLSAGAVLMLLMARYRIPHPLGLLLQWTGGPQVLIAIPLIHLGVLLHRGRMNLEACSRGRLALWAAACLCLLLAIQQLGPVRANAYSFPLVSSFLAASVSGWLLCHALVRLMPKRPQRLLAFFGRHTMPILLFHFLAFKLVSAVGVAAKGLPAAEIARFPVTFVGPAWCLAYTLVGVLVPVSLAVAYGSAKRWIVEAITERRVVS